jgi:GNAT superfamily N-acetyltransferase
MVKENFEIRPIHPEDKEGLKRGLAMLSSESKRQRFFSSRKDFTEKELTFFTEVDQHNHIAFLALSKNTTDPLPSGSIRCVRDLLHGRPDFAELAITIVDRFQGQGLGKALLDTLAEKALQEKINYLYGDFHCTNIKVQKLLEGYCVRHQLPPGSFHLQRQADGFLYFEMALA